MPNNDNELITPAIAIEFSAWKDNARWFDYIPEASFQCLCCQCLFWRPVRHRIACTDTHIFCDEMSAEL